MQVRLLQKEIYEFTRILHVKSIKRNYGIWNIRGAVIFLSKLIIANFNYFSLYLLLFWLLRENTTESNLHYPRLNESNV